MASDPSRHYETLTPPERFALLVEAMARRDEREADRLEDSCPRRTYRMDDAEFGDRVRRAHLIATAVTLNMREGLTQLRMARTFRDHSDVFATPVVRLVTAALLWGRAYGHWEAGAVEEVGVPNAKALAADLAATPYLGEQLDDLQVGVGEATRLVAEELQYAVGKAHAADLLSQWEGFGRFCRDVLGVEPLVLASAFGVGIDDLAAEVRVTCPPCGGGRDGGRTLGGRVVGVVAAALPGVRVRPNPSTTWTASSSSPSCP